MSATIHVELYREYFSGQGEYYGPLDCLSVGARRFPLTIKYTEDLERDFGPRCPEPVASAIWRNCKKISDMCRHCDGAGDATVPKDLAKTQYNVVLALVRKEVQRGTGVLVFVSGMGDIMELSSLLEDEKNCKVFAIHSDIPFEEQEAAFLPCGNCTSSAHSHLDSLTYTPNSNQIRSLLLMTY